MTIYLRGRNQVATDAVEFSDDDPLKALGLALDRTNLPAGALRRLMRLLHILAG